MPRGVPTAGASPPLLEASARAPSRLRRLGSILVGVLVVAFLAVTVVSQWHDLRDADVRFAPGWFAAAFVALFGFQIAQGEVAGLVLRGLGHPVPPRRMRAIYALGLLARYVPSGAVVFVVRIDLEEREGVPPRIAVVGVLYELAVALGAAAIVAALVFARVSAAAAVAGVVVAVVLVATGLHPRVFGRLADWVLRRIGRESMPRALSLKAVAALVVLVAVSFAFYGVGLLCICAGITRLGSSDWLTVFAAGAAGFFTGLLGFALPGGLGAREAGLTGVLSLVLAGPLALAVAVVSRLVQTAVELAYAGATTLGDRRRRGRSGVGASAGT